MVWDSDKISPWGPVEPESTGGGDLSLFEAFHGPATTAPATTGGNVLQQLYSRTPTYFAQYLKSDVQLTVETSLGWPLNFQIHSQVVTAPAGTSSLTIEIPQSTHWLISKMFVIVEGDSGAGKFVETIYRIISGIPSAGIPGSTITLHRYEMANNDRVAIIGTYSSEVHGAGLDFQDSCFGLRPLYIPHPHSLRINFEGLTGGGSINLRAMYLQLPESQPFGSLIGSL